MIGKTSSIIGLFFLMACTSQKIIYKTDSSYTEKLISTTTLYEFGPTEYLTEELQSSNAYKNDSIAAIAHEMLSQKMFFAKTKLVPEGVVIVQPAQEVEVVSKVFIKDIGDFYKIKLTSGYYLVKFASPQILLNKEEYDQLQLKNVAPEVKGNEVNDQKLAIDYFNSKSEDERLEKIENFCKQYPQFAKYKKYATQKQLTIGMPEHLLGLSWGQPARVAEEANESGVYRSFYYPGNYLVITKNHIIKTWKKSE